MHVNTILKRRDFFKTRFAIFYAFLSLICFFGGALKAQPFDKTKDILIAQFDNKPDCDDLHAQAALGSILLHTDGDGINYYAVMGTYGKQTSGPFFNSSTLFNMAFGVQNTNWTDAHTERAASVTRIHDKVKPILLAGGKAWVMEAGQSDVTLLWVNALIASGVPAATVKSNVMVVQHSLWNEGQASAGVLNDVKLKATYIPIDDGNEPSGTGTDRGPNTPDYKLAEAIYMSEALSASNPNANAKALWAEARRIEDALPDGVGYIKHGSNVDFSDGVEAWYILGLGDNASTVRKFWDRYVVNSTIAIPVTGVTLSGCPSSPLNVGSTVQLTATILPANATNKAVSWSSSNTAVATVSSTGLITALSAGSSTITVTTNDGGFTGTCNVTVIASVGFDAFSQIEAEGYSSMLGVQKQTCTEGGQNVAYINNGDYIVFNNVNFGTGAVTFEARVACGATGGSIEVRLGSITGTIVGTCSVTNTGGWQTWTTKTCAISGVSGTQNLYLKFTGGTGYLFNVNWFKFIVGSGAKLPQSISFSNLVPKTVGDADFNPGATANSGLAVTYESSNASVATIIGGNVHIVGAGTTIITASQVGNDIYEAATPVTQTLVVNSIPVTGITLSGCPTLPLNVGSTVQLSATVLPANATNKAVSWSSSNTAVAIVSTSGLITGITAGTATITVTTNDGGFTGTCNVTVIASVGFDAFSQIEAEGYNSMLGVQKQTCTEGGQNVAYINNGEYIVFNNVNFGTGAVSFEARVASGATGGSIEVRLGSITGTLVGTCAVTNTGGWQTWTTKTCAISGVSGTQNLYLKFTGGTGFLFNVNWFKFIAGSELLKAPSKASDVIDIANTIENIFSIYPNPVSDILNIDFSNTNISREIKAFNTFGQLVYNTKTKSSNVQINIQPLKLKGVLLVQVIEGNTIVNQKVLLK